VSGRGRVGCRLGGVHRRVEVGEHAVALEPVLQREPEVGEHRDAVRVADGRGFRSSADSVDGSVQVLEISGPLRSVPKLDPLGQDRGAVRVPGGEGVYRGPGRVDGGVQVSQVPGRLEPGPERKPEVAVAAGEVGIAGDSVPHGGPAGADGGADVGQAPGLPETVKEHDPEVGLAGRQGLVAGLQGTDGGLGEHDGGIKIPPRAVEQEPLAQRGPRGDPECSLATSAVHGGLVPRIYGVRLPESLSVPERVAVAPRRPRHWPCGRSRNGRRAMC
jgi:hypothetical protein